MKSLKSWAATATVLVLSCAAQASPLALVDLGNGTVYDPNMHLSWLKDWGSSGRNSWENSKIWAARLTVGGATAGQWRLPEIGEYGNLFTEYGNLTLNTLPFTRVQSDLYWSGTEYMPGREAWYFYPSNRAQGGIYEALPLYVVAVRPGDMASSVPPAYVSTSVPEPQTLALVLLALGATAAARRRRPR